MLKSVYIALSGTFAICIITYNMLCKYYYSKIKNKLNDNFL